jgi:hypothetical protein
MGSEEYVIVKEFQRMSPEEMYKRGIDKISVQAYVELHVGDLERGQAVYIPNRLIKMQSVRVAVTKTNSYFKQIYKDEGFSDRIRKYVVHKDGEGVVVVRLV